MTTDPVTVVPADPLPRTRWVTSWLALVRWSVIRHAYFLPVVAAVQVLFSVAVIYGIPLMLPAVDETTARYVSTGTWTLCTLAVGCVLAPQLLSVSKVEGLLDYQRTLPVPRSALLMSDVPVWLVIALPGIVSGIVAAQLRFSGYITVTLTVVPVILACQVTVLLIGYALTFWLPADASSLATQVILIGSLLFSPIVYPSDRLPGWLVTVHGYLPFVPVSRVIRHFSFPTDGVPLAPVSVIVVWTVVAYVLCLAALSRRK